MFRLFLRIAAAVIVLSPMAVLAEPIKLKLAYFTSDRSVNYLAAIKPFVDAVNDEGQGLVEIQVYFSGVLGAGQARQPGLVEKGVADIAFIVPGQNPEQFYDESVIELPGLFRSSGEATRVFTKLIAARALKGYENLYVIGAFASAEPCCINTRNVVASLQALKGLKISVNNRMEATALEKLGTMPVLIAAPQALAAISGGNIDGTSAPPSLLYEFGLGRVAIHHYVLATSAAPLALVMNRQKFDTLPEAAKALIRKFSGEWIATRWIEGRQARDAEVSDQIKSDTRRTVTIASPADLETTRQVYQTIIDDWADNSARNRELLYLVQAELAKVRAAEPGNIGAAAPKD